jgi:acetyl-CoA carboxylase biotin carboxylase subunit
LFSRILIANRGEIAIRVIRACRELGVASVAVYSDADAGSPHVLAADEAVHIGAAPASASYLKGDVIIEAAIRTGAQAIHPGYGFLSEREWFARSVVDAGLLFIGPSAAAIASLGSKTAARALAQSVGVPVVAGTTQGIQNAGDALSVAREVGFPLLLKASAGGGGKGMRVVLQESELAAAFDAAKRESMASFGDDAIYVEKYISRPRHVEIQLLADNHGNVLHFGERECSVQRRHQKMIEEAPSPAVDEALRKKMGESAVKLARAAAYTGAGTCEFLLDHKGDYYFLEMNTRLQVEHPVTEMVYGQDLVQWQIRVAAGEKLTLRQQHIVPRGWAMECRITSESPHDGFLPATGRIAHLEVPSGPGVRWDGGIHTGTEVGPHYDPMLAKLIVHAADRDGCVARMRRALRELAIIGVETSREFHMRVLEDEEFLKGEIDVQWLERRLPHILRETPPTALDEIAAVAAVLLSSNRANAGSHGASPVGEGRMPSPREGWPREPWRSTDNSRRA